jgi:hypothetical protein
MFLLIGVGLFIGLYFTLGFSQFKTSSNSTVCCKLWIVDKNQLNSDLNEISAKTGSKINFLNNYKKVEIVLVDKLDIVNFQINGGVQVGAQINGSDIKINIKLSNKYAGENKKSSIEREIYWSLLREIGTVDINNTNISDRDKDTLLDSYVTKNKVVKVIWL